MSRPIYCVITAVPDPYLGDNGNMASVLLASDRFPESDIYYEGSDERIHPLRWDDIKGDKWVGMSLVQPVFTAGELIVLDRQIEREISGMQRKPSKWYVDYEYFNNLEKAIQCAYEVTNREINKGLIDLGEPETKPSFWQKVMPWKRR